MPVLDNVFHTSLVGWKSQASLGRMKLIQIIQIIHLLLFINPTAHADDIDTPGGRIANRLSEPKPVKVTKCCPENQNLDVSDQKDPKCVDVEVEVSPFVKMKGLALVSDNARDVDIQLVKDDKHPYALPSCFSDFEVHRIEQHGITKSLFSS